MRTIGALLVLSAALSGWPMSARADCGEDCSNSCDAGPAEEWARCMEPCLKRCLKEDPPAVPDVPKPTPASEQKRQ